MEKNPNISNREVLEKKQWYSHKTGFVDLSTVSNEYIQNIVIFWKEDRRHIIAKIKRVTLAISKMKHDHPHRMPSYDKNKRRVEVVKLFDKLITEELIKRHIS